MHVRDGVKSFDPNILHPNILHFCVIYSLRIRCVKALTIENQKIFRSNKILSTELKLKLGVLKVPLTWLLINSQNGGWFILCQSTQSVQALANNKKTSLMQQRLMLIWLFLAIKGSCSAAGSHPSKHCECLGRADGHVHHYPARVTETTYWCHIAFAVHVVGKELNINLFLSVTYLCRFLQETTDCQKPTALNIRQSAATDGDVSQLYLNTFGKAVGFLQRGLKTNRSVPGTDTLEQFRSNL